MMLELDDPDQLLTYNAEHNAFKSTGLDDSHGLAAVAQWIAEISASQLWKGAKGRRVRLVCEPVGSDQAWTDPNRTTLHIPEEMASLATTCHELAHLISSSKHTAEFRRSNIELIRQVAGPESAAQLNVAYRAAGLEVASPTSWQPRAAKSLLKMDVATALILAAGILVVVVQTR